jgi:hypothetical protein
MRGIGVLSLVSTFRGYLAKPQVRLRLAPLQLGSRLEDYLVKEFMQFVYWQSKGRRYCACNVGNQHEQKVDIALLKKPAQEPVVEALVEVKYLQNRSLGSEGDNLRDQIRATLKDLQRQLRLAPSSMHGGYDVALRARSVSVYGLVLASYACRVDEEDAKGKQKRFIQKIRTVADELGLQYHDLPKPYLYPVYEGHPISYLGERWRVSLYAGLWRRRK